MKDNILKEVFLLTGIQEYVFVRAMGNPNRNTTTQRRLLKIF